jgi:hypothetical protein
MGDLSAQLICVLVGESWCKLVMCNWLVAVA